MNVKNVKSFLTQLAKPSPDDIYTLSKRLVNDIDGLYKSEEESNFGSKGSPPDFKKVGRGT